MIVGISVTFVVLQSVTVLTVATMPLFISVDLKGALASAGIVLGLCVTGTAVLAAVTRRRRRLRSRG